MKIALSFPGCHRRAGVERVMLECAQFLARRGHEVEVLANEWDEEFEGIRFIQVPMLARPEFLRPNSFFQNATKILKTRQFDAFSSHGSVCPIGGVHWVHSVQGAWLEQSKKMRPPRSWGRVRQRLNPLHPVLLRLEEKHFTQRQYRKIIALSPLVRDDLHRLYDVPLADIEIVTNGFSEAEFNVSRRDGREELRRSLGYNNSQKVVIFVANELERKGFGPLLRAIASLNEPDVHLLEVGRLDGASYANEIELLNMTSRVRFFGPSNDVGALYGAADVFALSTQYEAWGLVIVEAMATGIPVLTSRLAGAAIAVEEGKTGDLLDNPDDVEEIAAKLKPLLNHTALAPAAIAQSVEQFAWSRVLLRYEAILEANRN